MASGSISTAASALSRSPSASASAAASPPDRLLRLSFPRIKALTSLKGGRTAICNGETFVRKAQLTEIVGGSSNDGAAAFVSKKPDEEKVDEELGKETPLEEVHMTPEAISEFMDQVSDLVRLVDTKDVVELHLKQPGCELLIRKKEALPHQPSAMHAMVVPAPHSLHMPPPSPYSPPPLQQAASPSAPAPPPPAAAEAPQQQQASSSSLPPLKSPMAGTFYRSPAPGQPPFVKVGDKVRKGQILCIIEAMKMMNEIEADKDGTVIEILLEDAKPVGVGKPLFVIEP